MCADDGERRQFLDTLTELATDPRSSVTVVLAVRADFMGELADHDALRALVNDGTVLVGPLTPAEVRRAVERPAAVARLVLDDGLADTVVSDAGDEPGLLPLLSTAMAQLWERRDGSALTYAAYVGLGGLSGAIATLAEETYRRARRPPSRTPRALLLLRLTGPGDGAGVTRRRVPLSEVESLAAPAGFAQVVEELAAARLLTVSDGHVEVAHEALFREWPRLRGWLVEDAAGRAVQRRLAVAASEWDADGREASALWTGTRLASGPRGARGPARRADPRRARLPRRRTGARSTPSSARPRSAPRSTARQNRRLRWLVAGIGVVLVAALVAGPARLAVAAGGAGGIRLRRGQGARGERAQHRVPRHRAPGRGGGDEARAEPGDLRRPAHAAGPPAAGGAPGPHATNRFLRITPAPTATRSTSPRTTPRSRAIDAETGAGALDRRDAGGRPGGPCRRPRRTGAG